MQTNTPDRRHFTVPHTLLHLVLLSPTRDHPLPLRLHGDHDSDADDHNDTQHDNNNGHQRHLSPLLHLRRPLDLGDRLPIVIAATMTLAGGREAGHLLLEHNQQSPREDESQPHRRLLPPADPQLKLLLAGLRRQEIRLRRDMQ